MAREWYQQNFWLALIPPAWPALIVGYWGENHDDENFLGYVFNCRHDDSGDSRNSSTRDKRVVNSHIVYERDKSFLARGYRQILIEVYDDGTTSRKELGYIHDGDINHPDRKR